MPVVERVSRVDSGVGRPVDELRWPLRAVVVWFYRRNLRRHPVEGLIGLDNKGRAQWAPGYPEALYRR